MQAELSANICLPPLPLRPLRLHLLPPQPELANWSPQVLRKSFTAKITYLSLRVRSSPAPVKRPSIRLISSWVPFCQRASWPLQKWVTESAWHSHASWQPKAPFQIAPRLRLRSILGVIRALVSQSDPSTLAVLSCSTAAGPMSRTIQTSGMPLAFAATSPACG